ncbi:hypothetical protein TNCV_1396591 [Trichonephila clavipes]|nr:hypothetical protein TNCV_1396591 [Trichonephila clavipes]
MRKDNQHDSESVSVRIMAYRKCGLSFHDISARIGRNPTTVIRIWNRSVKEWAIEHHAGSQWPPVTNV